MRLVCTGAYDEIDVIDRRCLHADEDVISAHRRCQECAVLDTVSWAVAVRKGRPHRRWNNQRSPTPLQGEASL